MRGLRGRKRKKKKGKKKEKPTVGICIGEGKVPWTGEKGNVWTKKKRAIKRASKEKGGGVGKPARVL